MQHLLAVSLFAACASAQTFLHLPASGLPETTELASYNLRPFMQTNSRVQMFFSATEVGSQGFLANALALRYDGPIPQVGAPGPFAIQRLRIAVGTTTVPLPAADFGANLSQPLTPVFDGPWTYLPDPGFGSPHPFGGPGNSLRFPFVAPAAIAIPPGGWFVVDLQMTGNNIANFGFSHAIVDGVRTSGGPTTGTAVDFGQGCPAAPAQPAATMTTTGVYAPGAAHFVGGQNLGANSFVLCMVGGDNVNSQYGPLPVNLPGTSCDLFTSGELWFFMLANGAGAIVPGQGSALSVPANTAFSGVTVYEQLLAFSPAANFFGMALSNMRAVTLGSLASPGIGVYTVSHGADADATIADSVDPFGYAVRLEVN